MKIIFRSFVLASLAFFTTSSFAISQAGLATFTPGAGAYLFTSKRHLQNVTVPFFAIGYNFTEEWGIEGLLGFFNTDFNKNVNIHREVSGTLFAVDAMYHFLPCQRIQPFALAGVGILGLSPNRSDANNQGNINAGLGVQFFANEIVAFRVEARDFYTLIGGKNDVFLDAGVTFLLNPG